MSRLWKQLNYVNEYNNVNDELIVIRYNLYIYIQIHKDNTYIHENID